MKNKKNYDQLAAQVLELMGGKDNITFFAHCMTRLRFNVKDKGLVKEKEIDSLEGLVGCQWNGEQFQIIVGDTVNSVYDAVCKKGGFLAEKAVDEDPDSSGKEKLTLKQVPNRVIETLSACMTPILPLLLTVGLLCAVYSIIGPSCLNLVSAESDIYRLLFYVSQAGLYFLPISVTITASKKFGCNTMYALMITFAMLYPDFSAVIAEGNFTIYGIPVYPTTYSGQILQAILICWIMSYVEGFFKKVLPEVLKTTFLGILTLLVMLPVSFCLLAPAGYIVGDGISKFLVGVYNFAGPLGTALVGLCWVPLIIAGMHMPLGMFAGITLITTGVESTVMPVTLALIGVAPAVNAAVFLKTKDKKEKELSVSGLVSILLGGVVEPSLYGIYLKHKKVLVSCLAGHAAAGFMMGLLHVSVYVPTSSNFLAMIGYIGPTADNLIKAIIAILVGMAVAFGMIMVLGVEDKKKVNA